MATLHFSVKDVFNPPQQSLESPVNRCPICFDSYKEMKGKKVVVEYDKNDILARAACLECLASWREASPTSLNCQLCQKTLSVEEVSVIEASNKNFYSYNDVILINSYRHNLVPRLMEEISRLGEELSRLTSQFSSRRKRLGLLNWWENPRLELKVFQQEHKIAAKRAELFQLLTTIERKEEFLSFSNRSLAVKAVKKVMQACATIAAMQYYIYNYDTNSFAGFTGLFAAGASVLYLFDDAAKVGFELASRCFKLKYNVINPYTYFKYIFLFSV